MHKNGLKKIIVMGTGGTITGIGEKGKTIKYKSGEIALKDLIDSIPQIHTLANLEIKEILKIDSCDLESKHWMDIARFINEASQKEDVDGFVLAHGTDTLEETAFFLNLTVKTHKPVVLTGAMRPATAMSPDGPFNLFQAVALARSDEAVGKGVLVNFSDAFYGARDVQKVNTYRPSAFNHKDLGCFGFIRDSYIHFYNCSTKRHTLESEFDLNGVEDFPAVAIAYFHAGADSEILDYFYDKTQGLVVAGAGCGCCSTSWNKKIKKMMREGYPVVRSSRISNGLVTGDFEKTSDDMEIYSDTFSPQKARILLSLALNKTKDLSEISRIFRTY